MVNNEGRVIGVLQLIDSRDAKTGGIIPFGPRRQRIGRSASRPQAAIALDNKLLLEGQKKLLESFIKLIASAIRREEPVHRASNASRVPVITR